jgi:hypothetical protein
MNGTMERNSEKCVFIFRLNLVPKMEKKSLSKKSEHTYFSLCKNPQDHILLKIVAHR